MGDSPLQIRLGPESGRVKRIRILRHRGPRLLLRRARKPAKTRSPSRWAEVCMRLFFATLPLLVLFAACGKPARPNPAGPGITEKAREATVEQVPHS
jgi:hypothetical protein